MFAQMYYVALMTLPPAFPDSCQQALADHMRPELFKALCDPVRVSIVATLAAGPQAQSVSDLAGCCGIDFSGVSRHLKILRQAGVVAAVKDGRTMLYSLNTDALAHTLKTMGEALLACRDMAVK